MAFGSTLLNQIKGATGKALTTVGTALKAPQITKGGLGAQLQSSAGYALANMPQVRRVDASQGVQGASTRQSPVTPGMTSDFNQFQDYAAQQRALANQGGSGGGGYSPATSGQSFGGDSGGGGGDGGYDYVAALRESFNQSRAALEGMLPTYDSDFSNFKTNVESGIGRAKDTLQAQNSEDELMYGQSLKSLLQNDQSIRQRQQGVFSGLNALDSSAYKDDVLKQDQFLQEQQSGLGAEKQKTYDQRQRDYAAYEQDATSKISSYQNEITRAKQALQQSIASTNMDEASSIQNYISQLQAQQQQINQGREAFAMQLAQLQAQGTDVVGNLSKTNLGAFTNQFGQGLSSRLQSALGRYAQPQGGVVGSGFIGSSSMNDDQKRQLGLLRA